MFCIDGGPASVLARRLHLNLAMLPDNLNTFKEHLLLSQSCSDDLAVPTTVPLQDCMGVVVRVRQHGNHLSTL